jgi:hypothetical protein
MFPEAAAESDQKRKVNKRGGSMCGDSRTVSGRMPKVNESGEFTGPAIQEKDADFKKRSQIIPALLNAEKHETKAGDDYEQTEFEVLAAVQESIPCPQALRDGHGEEFDGHDEEENAAKTHGGSHNVEQCADAGPGGDGEWDHARLDCWILEGDHWSLQNAGKRADCELLRFSIASPRGGVGIGKCDFFLRLFCAVDAEEADVVAVDFHFHVVG